MDLNNLRDEIYEDAVAHGLWEAADDDFKFVCVGVLEEDIPKLRREFYMEFVRDEVHELDMACDDEENFIEELADVIIMSLSVAGKLGIDIDAAVRRKMEINKNRPWKHGRTE